MFNLYNIDSKNGLSCNSSNKMRGFSMKKIIAQLLILTLVFGSFAVFPAGAAAEEVGDAVYYNRTYDEE